MGFPKVNIVLRKTIKVLFPEEAEERQNFQELFPDYKSVIAKFESLNIKHQRQSSVSEGAQLVQHQHVNFSVSKIIFVTMSILGIAIFTYSVLNLFVGNKESLVRKSVLRWGTTDVVKWVRSLGSWAQGYDEKFLTAGIDGNLLLSLSEYDLEHSPLNMKPSYHRRAFLKEIENLRTLGVKSPTDVWEYKAAHPVLSIFLLWGLREFPRLTVASMFFAYDEEVFQPLLYYTSEVDLAENINEVALPSEEYLRFGLRLLLVPYYLIARFTIKCFYLNYWVGCVVLAYCVLMTLVEFSKLKWLLFMGGWRQLPTLGASIASTAFINGLFQLVLWQILPAFICDIAFYWMLFLAPYSAWNSFKARLSEDEGGTNITRDFLMWLWRNAKLKLQQLGVQRHL